MHRLVLLPLAVLALALVLAIWSGWQASRATLGRRLTLALVLGGTLGFAFGVLLSLASLHFPMARVLIAGVVIGASIALLGFIAGLIARAAWRATARAAA